MDRQLFVSYRWDDGDFVRAFAAELKAFNYNVWIDRDKLRVGDSLVRDLSHAIGDSACFILFLSRSAYDALANVTGGFNVEIEEIMALRRSRAVTSKPPAILIVECAPFSDDQIAAIEFLRPFSSSIRLQGSEAYKSFQMGDSVPLRTLVRQFVRQVLRDELRVFPRSSKLTETAYLLSWISAGTNDQVDIEREHLEWEGEKRPVIPLSTGRGQPCLVFTARHRLREPVEQSWWCAGIGLDFDGYGSWKSIDLTRYKTLQFEGRAGDLSGGKMGVPQRLLVCLGDNRRQSSSWNKVELTLISAFRVYDFDLDAHFGWTRSACPMNTTKVNRSAIEQIMFGQDPKVESSEVRFEIRNICFVAR